MSTYLIQEIRACLCKPGKQEPAANKLTDDQLLEVFNRLRKGQNPNEIGRYAQKAWGFMEGRNPHTVGQIIRTLQKRISHLTLGGSPSQTQAPGPVSDTVIPVKVTYEDIIEIQDRLSLEMRRRKDRLMEKERATRIPYKDSAKDLNAISSFGRLLTKMEEFELKNADLPQAQKGGGAEEQEKLSAQHRLVERSLDLMEKERATGIPYEDASKDFMAILSCAKSLLKDRQFKLKNADLIKERKRQRDDLIIKGGFERIIAKDKDKALSAFLKMFLKEMEMEIDKTAVSLEEAAEKAGMTLEEFERKRVLSHEEFDTLARERMVHFFGMISNMEEEALDTLLSAFASDCKAKRHAPHEGI